VAKSITLQDKFENLGARYVLSGTKLAEHRLTKTLETREKA
jgi:hypothetical protein